MKKTTYLHQIILVMLSICLYGTAAGNTSLGLNDGGKKPLFASNIPVFKDIFYLSSKNDGGLVIGNYFTQSLTAAITASQTSICKGTSTTLTAALTGGSQPFNYAWSNGETTPSVSVSPNANTNYSLTVTDADGNSISVSQLIEVKEAPLAPFSVSFVDCGSTLPKAHSTPYGFNQTFEWYSNPNRTGDIIPSRLIREVQDGETSIVSDFVFNRGTTTFNTSYYVFEKGSNGCYSPATEVPITVYPVPQTTPNVVTNFACGTSFKFEAIPSGNNTIEWRTDFRAIFFGETVGTENSYTLLNPENKKDSLWVFEVSPNRCYGAPALVRIFPTPPAPPVTDISLCVGDASKPIFTNPDYRWYTAPTGDFPRFPAAEIVATAPSSSTFYISQIVDGCVSATRSELKAIVSPIPAAPTVIDIEYCQNETASALTAGGDNLKWYDKDGVLLNGAPTPSTSAVGQTSYSVSQTVNNCESPKAIINVKIKASPNIPSVSSVLQPTCSISTGKIVLNVQNGVEYSFDNGLTYSVLSEKSGLNAGDYTIKVKNSAGCESGILTVKIDAAPSAPSTPSVSSVLQPTCSVSTGKIVLNTQAGVEYSFDNGLTYSVLSEKSGLNASDYTIKVKNAAGCESGILTVKIDAAPNAPSTPSVSSVLQPTCSVSTGKIVLNVQNGVEYSFDNGLIYQISNEKSGLSAGDYTIKVKNATGCESGILTVKIDAAPSAPSTPSVSSVMQPTCNVSTGKIVLNVQNGVEYSFDNGLTYSVLSEKSGLNAGDYTIKVKNSAGCESGILTVKIDAAPSAPSTPSVSSVMQPTCNVSTGKIVLNVQIGVEYSFDNGLTYSILSEKSGLSAGDYTIKVKNATGCESGILTVKIDAAPSAPSTPSVSSVIQPTCSVSTGKIVLNTQVGVEYSFDNGLTYSILSEKSGLSAGDYTIKVKNAAGCESGILTVKIDAAPNAPSIPSVSSVIQPTCSVSTGKIVLNTQAGVEYSFDNGLTYSILSEKLGLSAGDYTIKVKNSAGCESGILTVKIDAAPSAPSTPSVSSVMQPTCNVSTGKIVLNTQVGVEYSFDNGLTYSVLSEKSGLNAGDYTIKVKNVAGCESGILTVKIDAAPNAPSTPSVSSVLQPTCSISTGKIVLNTQAGVEYSFDNGLTYSILSEKSGLNAGDYFIKVRTLAGCESAVLKVTINPIAVAPSTPSVSSVVHATCSVPTGTISINTQTGVEYSFDNGTSYQTANVKSGLAPGTYKIKVKNSAGCESATIEVAINAAATSLPTWNIHVTQPTCTSPKGTIAVTYPPSGYLYSFDNGVSFQPSNTKSGLAVGTYSVVIKNYSGCVSAPKVVSIVAPVNTTMNSIIASQTTVCSGETVKLSVAPYTPTCIYKWSNGASTDPIYVNPTTTTTYTVTVTNGGCTSVASKTITVYPKLAKPKVTIVHPTCSTLGTITITNLPAGASSKINGMNWTLGKVVYSNLESGTYKVKIKLNDCESEEEKVVLNDAGFNFDPTKCYKIVNKNSGKVLDVFQGKNSNNIPIIQFPLNGSGNQKWQFSYTTGGYLKIKVQSSGKYLACHDNYNGANVYQYDYYSGGQKDWAIECVGNGDFRIVHRYSGKYLSIENNSKVDAAKVEIRNWMNLDAQKWQIVEVPCDITANLRQAGYMTAKAEAEVNQINITWYSNMGYKTDYYTVEKFNEQKEQFEEISTLNNTQYDDKLNYFTYSDMTPIEGGNLYRIKAVFYDGTVQLSPSLKVAFGNINSVRLFPNPAVDYIDIVLNDAPKNAVTLTLNNMLGLPVIVKSYENEQRMHFEIKDIPNGIYQLHISQKGKRSIVKQVVIQK